MLDLFFETPDPHADARGAYRFVLYRTGDRYPLPDVVLRTEEGTATVPVQEAGIAEVTGDRRETLQLRETIRSQWDAHTESMEHVAARHLLARDRSVPADVVDQARSGPQDVLAVGVTWQYLYTDVSGLQAAGRRTARLEFAQAGRKPPARPSQLDADAEREGVPAPIRSVGTRRHYPNFAAIDFGTSASTVTLYDARDRPAYSVDPGQAQVLRAGFAALLRSGAPAHLAPEWDKAVAALANQVHEVYPAVAADPGALCTRLQNVTDVGSQSDQVLDLVCAGFERLVADADQGLARWVGPQLLSCYDEAFAIPPLDSLRLRPVPLDKQRFEVPTEVTITHDAPVAIELGTWGAGGRRDLKSRLGDPEPLGEGKEGADGKDATTDDLIALVYKELIERTERFLRPDDSESPEEALAQLVVTFPTITPPATRLHLTRMMERTLDLITVSVRYDEGVAAALYFLMRDFGGNRAEFGAEALRARSVQDPADPRQWRQNMLVIDIGAGTTDIVLLRLTLLESPVEIDGVDPAVQGKYYVVQPEVINSTGHPQLGGNYLTLRVFYWLKAAIIDALLAGAGQDRQRREFADRARQELGLSSQDPVPGLADAVVHGVVEKPVPGHVRDALRGLLRTHWQSDAADEDKQAFWLLWDIAEEAKIALGGELADPRGYWIEHDRIRVVVNAIHDEMSDVREALIPAEGIWLSQDDFRALATPVITHAAELAWWLVQRSLGGDMPERLDRVMLSGKTSMMELTRHVIAAELGGGPTSADGAVPWNPAAISVERQYAKQAASIGAAWAQETTEHLTTKESEVDQLRMGRSVLSIDVDNVSHALPCEFVLLRPMNQTSRLLAAGTPLVEIDQSGRLAARREWTDQEPWPALMPAFEVHRPIRPDKTQVWGTYHFQREAKFERGFSPDPRIWLTSATGEEGARIRAQLEIDQRLVPTLHLSQGRPHYLVGPDGALDLRSVLPDQCWSPQEGGLRMLPATVVIVGGRDKQHPDGEHELFPPWLPADGDLSAGYFPDFFHEHAGLDSGALPGRIAFTLPPPADGEYRLLLRRPGEPDREVDRVRVRAWGQRTARYTATLDTRGRLALHRGVPPYWPAGTLRDVEAHPGAVLRCEMRQGKTERDPDWDPFNGKH